MSPIIRIFLQAAIRGRLHLLKHSGDCRSQESSCQTHSGRRVREGIHHGEKLLNWPLLLHGLRLRRPLLRPEPSPRLVFGDRDGGRLPQTSRRPNSMKNRSLIAQPAQGPALGRGESSFSAGRPLLQRSLTGARVWQYGTTPATYFVLALGDSQSADRESKRSHRATQCIHPFRQIRALAVGSFEKEESCTCIHGEACCTASFRRSATEIRAAGRERCGRWKNSRSSTWPGRHGGVQNTHHRLGQLKSCFEELIEISGRARQVGVPLDRLQQTVTPATLKSLGDEYGEYLAGEVKRLDFRVHLIASAEVMARGVRNNLSAVYRNFDRV